MHMLNKNRLTPPLEPVVNQAPFTVFAISVSK